MLFEPLTTGGGVLEVAEVEDTEDDVLDAEVMVGEKVEVEVTTTGVLDCELD